jgi:hypothetical protein
VRASGASLQKRSVRVERILNSGLNRDVGLHGHFDAAEGSGMAYCISVHVKQTRSLNFNRYNRLINFNIVKLVNLQ